MPEIGLLLSGFAFMFNVAIMTRSEFVKHTLIAGGLSGVALAALIGSAINLAKA